MNLGGILGEQKLRIMQMEDDLRSRGLSPSAAIAEARSLEGSISAEIHRYFAVGGSNTESPKVHAAPAPPARGGVDRGLKGRVRAALPDYPPGETISEIAAFLGDVPAKIVSCYMCICKDVVKTGERGKFRYWLPR